MCPAMVSFFTAPTIERKEIWNLEYVDEICYRVPSGVAPSQELNPTFSCKKHSCSKDRAIRWPGTRVVEQAREYELHGR
jgi:hypothetical protein